SNGSFTVAGGHTYTDEGGFVLGVSITNPTIGGPLLLSGLTTVAEADVLAGQGATVHLHPNQAFSGAVATFTDVNLAAVAGDFTATIDWGDGTTTSGLVSGGNGAFTVSGAHTYVTDGTKALSVTLSDDAPGTASATAHGSAEVTIPLTLQ